MLINDPLPDGVNGWTSRIVRATYDFAKLGGAVSTIALLGGVQIPKGATIVGGYIEVLTQLTSGGSATIAVQVEGANDIVGAIAVATWTVGRKQIIPSRASAADLSAAADIRTTAKRGVSAVVATAALTAGKFAVVLEYIDPLK